MILHRIPSPIIRLILCSVDTFSSLTEYTVTVILIITII